MAYRLGTNTYWDIYEQASYGVMPTTASVAPVQWNQTMNIKTVHSPLEKSVKSGTMLKSSCTSVFGYKQGQAVLSGAFNISDTLRLFESYMQSTDLTQMGTTTKSYTIVEYDSANIKCRYMPGAVVKSIQISHTVKNLVQMNVTFAGQAVSNWGAIPAMTGPYAYMELSSVCKNSYTDMNVDVPGILTSDKVYSSFDITFDTQYFQDEIKYGKSLQPSDMTSALKSVNMTLTFPFDAAASTLQSAVSKIKNISIYIDGKFYIYFHGQITSYEAADPDQGIWLNTITIQGVSDDPSESPIIISQHEI